MHLFEQVLWQAIAHRDATHLDKRHICITRLVEVLAFVARLWNSIRRIGLGPIVCIDMLIVALISHKGRCKGILQLCSLMSINVNREIEVSNLSIGIGEGIGHRSDPFGRPLTQDHLVVCIDYAIVILIYHLNLARLLSILGCCVSLIKLPDSVKLIVIVHVDSFTDEPLVRNIILRATIKFLDLVLVGGEHEVALPLESSCLDIDGVQSHLDTTIANPTYIIPDRCPAAGAWKLTFHDKVLGIALIYIDRTIDAIVEETIIQANIDFVGLLPGEFAIGKTVLEVGSLDGSSEIIVLRADTRLSAID